MLCCGREQGTPFCGWCGRTLIPGVDPLCRVCADCGRVFLVPDEPHARTDRLYCGGTCRTRAYRHRKAAGPVVLK